MTIFKKSRLDSKGFGNVGLLLVIVLMIAIVGVGSLVYKHEKNNDTVLAATNNWTPLGSFSDYTLNSVNYKIRINFSACLENVGNIHNGVHSYVKGLVTATGGTVNSFTGVWMSANSSASAANSTWTVFSGNRWNGDEVSLQHSIVPSQTNLIQFGFNVDNGLGPVTTMKSASILATCGT